MIMDGTPIPLIYQALLAVGPSRVRVTRKMLTTVDAAESCMILSDAVNIDSTGILPVAPGI
jgi:hypothetical protein